MMNGELQKQSEFPAWIKASIIEEAKKAIGTSSDADAIGLIVANELVKVATRILQDETIAPFDVGTELNQILLSSIATKDELGYCTPYDAFKRIV